MDFANPKQRLALPLWVPQAARTYLLHTLTGRSIRALARDQSCHPSTILRQIRRCEGRRDDPLVDDVLRQLARLPATTQKRDTKTMPCELLGSGPINPLEAEMTT